MIFSKYHDTFMQQYHDENIKLFSLVIYLHLHCILYFILFLYLEKLLVQW